MATVDKIPGMQSGATGRNVAVGIGYLILFPIMLGLVSILITLSPLILAVIVSKNYWGIADQLDLLPGVTAGGGIKAGVASGLYAFIVLAVVAAAGGTDDPNGDDTGGEIDDNVDDLEETDDNAEQKETYDEGAVPSDDEEAAQAEEDDPPEEDEVDIEDNNDDTQIEEDDLFQEDEVDAEADADEEEASEEPVFAEEDDDLPEDAEEDLTEDEQESAVVDSAAEAEGALEITDMEVEGDDPEDEYIELTNVGDVTLDMSDWTVRDREEDGVVDGRNFDPVTFPSGFELEPDDSVRIVTAEGEDTDETVHWGYGTQNWNQDGDVIIVLDGDGEEVLRYEYGDPPE